MKNCVGFVTFFDLPRPLTLFLFNLAVLQKQNKEN